MSNLSACTPSVGLRTSTNITGNFYINFIRNSSSDNDRAKYGLANCGRARGLDLVPCMSSNSISPPEPTRIDDTCTDGQLARRQEYEIGNEVETESNCRKVSTFSASEVRANVAERNVQRST